MRREDDIPLSEDERRLAERGKDLVAAAVAGTSAPQNLREEIERARERAQSAARPPFWRRHLRPIAAAATAGVAVALAIVLLSGGGGSAPSLEAVQATASLTATRPAPAPEGGDPPVLAARVGPIAFPDWRKSFGWSAVGSRVDSISGRSVETVFYRNRDGATLAYSIVAGEPIAEHPPGLQVSRDGNSYHVARGPGHVMVTWTQQGHTCTIVAPAAVPASRVVELAASRNPGRPA
jgi:hypothetical protein